VEKKKDPQDLFTPTLMPSIFTVMNVLVLVANQDVDMGIIHIAEKPVPISTGAIRLKTSATI